MSSTRQSSPLRAFRRLPGHASASTARRERAPRVENSIESRIEEVVMPRRQGDERFCAKRRAIDRASELRFEGRHAIAQLLTVRRPG